MKVLIIEDEKSAARRLKVLLQRAVPELLVVDTLDSVKLAVSWFASGQQADLVFMDIQLSDGLSFDIFEQEHVNLPVIFTTAYDQYAIRAFKVNSIDYLLKPIDPDELAAALLKYRSHFLSGTADTEITVTNLQQIQQTMQMLTQQYKSRFIVKTGEHIKAIPIEEICYFSSQEKVTFLHSHDGKRYILDYSLDQLENLLDPKKYMRISRKHIVGIHAIRDIIVYSSSRLRLQLYQSQQNDILVSRERVNKFKEWLDT